MGQALNFERKKHMILEEVDENKYRVLGTVTCDRCGDQGGVITGVRYECG